MQKQLSGLQNICCEGLMSLNFFLKTLKDIMWYSYVLFELTYFVIKYCNFLLLHKMDVHYHLEKLGSVRFLFEYFWKKKKNSYAHQSCIIDQKHSKTVIL